MSIYRLAGRVGGYARAALYDGRAMTATARERFAASFLEGHGCRVCPSVELPSDLLPGERKRRAEALRRAHYARVALASSRARSNKKAGPRREPGPAVEARQHHAEHPAEA
jgi:hypothetical protein